MIETIGVNHRFGVHHVLGDVDLGIGERRGGVSRAGLGPDHAPSIQGEPSLALIDSHPTPDHFIPQSDHFKPRETP